MTTNSKMLFLFDETYYLKYTQALLMNELSLINEYKKEVGILKVEENGFIYIDNKYYKCTLEIHLSKIDNDIQLFNDHESVLFLFDILSYNVRKYTI